MPEDLVCYLADFYGVGTAHVPAPQRANLASVINEDKMSNLCPKSRGQVDTDSSYLGTGGWRWDVEGDISPKDPRCL